MSRAPLKSKYPHLFKHFSDNQIYMNFHAEKDHISPIVLVEIMRTSRKKKLSGPVPRSKNTPTMQ